MPVIQKKICLLGDFAVGKTSLVSRFVEGRFDDRYISTIGVKISRKPLTRLYGDLNLLVWDLAGGDEFTLQSSYLRGAAGALIVCDLTRRETLAAFERYARQVQLVSASAPVVFIGNKVDLEEARAISDADLREASAPFGGHCFVSSAKTGAQVEAAFLCLADELEK